MAEKIMAKGLAGVVASDTALSFIDGERGVLAYRGYDIHDLAREGSFAETVYLLWNDRLPTRDELDEFEARLASERALDPSLVDAIRRAPTDVPAMAVLRTGVSAAGLHDPDAEDGSPEANRRKAARLVAKIPTIIAAFQRLRNGQEPLDPREDLSHAANFLYMVRGEEPSETAERALDRTLLLYLDHGFNASTFTCRVIASTLSDMHSAITGGIGALKGDLHGGANARAMEMLLEIGEEENVVPYLDDALERKQKIMGFGHRVYRVEDPRATHLRRMSEELTRTRGMEKWYRISRRLEEEMTGRKGIYPNVDFYCATVYYALGLPTDLYTPLFAAGRVGGWAAHVMEQLADNRLIRPRAEYVGPTDREYVPVDRR